jgi:molecular chaperone Hsp33
VAWRVTTRADRPGRDPCRPDAGAADPDRRPDEGQRYQGIVDLDGETLSECFTNYFVMSQQVGTRFKLCADGRHARGLLLQQLPADRLKDEEERAASWQHITALASTLTADEC